MRRRLLLHSRERIGEAAAKAAGGRTGLGREYAIALLEAGAVMPLPDL
jgi:hypothetical protein